MLEPSEQAAVEQLTACRDPLLIGVRHHSAAMAGAIPELLDSFQPAELLIELPPEFTPWIPWLGANELVAPVALAGTGEGTAGLSFYPFADFSPELAAIRWAVAHEVPVVLCDLPLADRGQTLAAQSEPVSSSGLLRELLQRTQAEGIGELWEMLVESPASGSPAEAIRTAGLLFGWALRSNDQQPSEYDHRREAYMRDCLAQASRPAAVVGAYHAAALLPEPVLWSARDAATTASAAPRDTSDDSRQAAEITTALIPYSFAQLDERSGYPAGIRDPQWHQQVFQRRSPGEVAQATSDFVVQICRRLRAAGHPANAAQAKEVVRMARDLASLRGYSAPGRGELLEALQCCLTQGELLGLGRAVAASVEEVLIGDRRGELPAEVPRSGLAPHVEAVLERLKLPREVAREPKRLRLDPLRSRLDRARVTVLERLATCDIPYAARIAAPDDSLRETLTEVWDVQWTHATSAMLELSSARGATLEQAALSMLSLRPREDAEAWSGELVARVARAARCGLGTVVERGLRELLGEYLLQATLPQLTVAMHLVEQIRAGHVPGLPGEADAAFEPFVSPFQLPDAIDSRPLLQAAVSQLPGLQGSERLEDAASLLDLILWFQQQPEERVALDSGQLLWSLRQLAADGSPLMQGAALAAQLLLDQLSDAAFGIQLAGWLDAAVDRDARRILQHRLQGALTLALPRIGAQTTCLLPLQQRLATLADHDFLTRLPALRGGFHVLSPAARERLLRQLLGELVEPPTEPSAEQSPASSAAAAGAAATSSPADAPTVANPLLAARRVTADRAGRAAVAALLPDFSWDDALRLPAAPTPKAAPSPAPSPAPSGQSELPLATRWQLILGSPPERPSPLAACAARALDELYGAGRGEGSHGGLGGGAGQGEGYPDVRTWAGELEATFGEAICEEVLGTAAAEGRTAALLALDEGQVTPSIELLEQVLSLKGSLPAGQTQRLRRLAKRIIDQLVRELAARLQPALTGLATPRPTRRPTPRLDLPRTIRANLHTARKAGERTVLLPERWYFRGMAKRSLDWHLIFVVDISGSMEASVIYSAMMSAIFTGLPGITVQFLAFNTQVIDFTDRVADPLELLLEVEVGGGTHIAKGLRAARQRIRVPQRSLVLLVTDFEEGWPLGGLLQEVRAAAETGARCLGLAALSDDGKPRYNRAIAQQVVAAGMPVAALSPSELAHWIGKHVR